MTEARAATIAAYPADAAAHAVGWRVGALPHTRGERDDPWIGVDGERT